MPKRDDQDLLKDMILACEEIADFMEGCEKSDFFKSRLLQMAIIKEIEILGEAAGRVSDELKQQHTNIPWREIISMRNILVHVYHGVELSIVWSVVETFAPSLLKDLRKIVL